jgi:hypothetical protein
MTAEGLWIPLGEFVYQATGDSDGVRLRVERGCYANGNTAVRAVVSDTGEAFATLSSNTDEQLPAGEFFLKYWSENAEIADVFARLHFVELVYVEEPTTGYHSPALYRIIG